MKPCGKKITELQKVEKVSRALISKFDHIVTEIEESKDVSEMNLE